MYNHVGGIEIGEGIRIDPPYSSGNGQAQSRISINHEWLREEFERFLEARENNELVNWAHHQRLEKYVEEAITQQSAERIRQTVAACFVVAQEQQDKKLEKLESKLLRDVQDLAKAAATVALRQFVEQYTAPR